jgi:hypothetical protein
MVKSQLHIASERFSRGPASGYGCAKRRLDGLAAMTDRSIPAANGLTAGPGHNIRVAARRVPAGR